MCDWIDEHQLARRNLTPDQASLIRGRRYNRTKKQGFKGNQHTVVASGQNVHNQKPRTAEVLAAQHGVDEKTIRRDGQFAQAIERVKAVDPGIQARVIANQGPPKAAVVKAAQILEKDPEKAKAILQGERKTADVMREMKREGIRAKLEDIKIREAKEVQGVFDVIVIDPPWPMQKIERDERPNQSEFDYPTMSLEEIKAFSIPHAEDCHLWLWTTQKFLPSAFDFLESWRARYVCTFVWHKPGGFQPVNLPQYNCEFVLYARIGSPKFIDTKAFSTCFQAARGRHSEKPDLFYEMIRRVTAGRRLDMFSRRSIAGFESWGNEA